MKYNPFILIIGAALIFLAALLFAFSPAHAPVASSQFGQQGSFWMLSDDDELQPIDALFGLRVDSLDNCTSLQTDANGVFSCGSGGGGGGGGLASSTPWNVSGLTYLRSNGNLSTVATTTLTASGALSLSQPIVVVGSSASALTIADAAADGTTKGAASFTAADFDASSGNISLDYTNAQKATASVPGFLTAADWSSFNNKISSTSLSFTDTGRIDGTYTSGTGVITADIVADSITDTYLAFNTGQNLTTASSPTFAGLTLSSPLTVANGGTGAATLTGVLKGNGTSAFTVGVDGTDFTLVNAVSCTNQVMTALTAAGVGTCSSINNAYWSGTDLSVANGGTGLSTFGGTNHILYTTAADTLSSEAAFIYNPTSNILSADNVGVATTTPLAKLGVEQNGETYSFLVGNTGSTTPSLNVLGVNGNGNVGIKTQTPTYSLDIGGTGNIFRIFYNAATAILSVVDNVATALGTWDFTGAILRLPYGAAPTISTNGDTGIDSTSNQFKYQSGGATRVLGNGNFYPAFTYATTTAWTGTTTIPLGTAYVGETWNGVQCFTDTGTLNVSFYDGTNRMNLFNASTTVGTVALSSNNTFTAAEKRYVDVGTPASTPTKISCTVSKSLTAD